MIFKNRKEAGERLAGRLLAYKNQKTVILAIPRGGVAVALPISKKLDAPLEVVGVRKIGAPNLPELGLGAISEGSVKIFDEALLGSLGFTKKTLSAITKKEEAELHRRLLLYRKKELPSLAGKTAILVDDGLATGTSAKAAAIFVRRLKPKKIIFAAPVCAADASGNLKDDVDQTICLESPSNLDAISSYYRHFGQMTDEDVLGLLGSARRL